MCDGVKLFPFLHTTSRVYWIAMCSLLRLSPYVSLLIMK